MAHKSRSTRTRRASSACAQATSDVSTEGYSSKDGAKNAIASIQKNGPEAPIEDNS